MNTLPFAEEHDCSGGSCTDALDFSIGNDIVVSSAQGIVTSQRETVQTCSADGGLGNYARVWVPDAYDVVYAHLEYNSVVNSGTAVGYIWMNVFSGVESFFCPNVSGGDTMVDLTDALDILDRYGSTDPWWDVDGVNAVDLTDALIVLDEFGKVCLPS